MRTRPARLLLAAIVFGSGCTLESQSEDEVAAGASAVQSANRNLHYAYVKTRTRADFATANVSVPLPLAPLPDGTPYRGTCGVTFVTPRYAVTAGHCVEDAFVNPATASLTVTQYNIDAVSDTRLSAAEVVSGTFPNYTRSALTSADGYQTTTFTGCKVVVRCGSAWGPYNCPAGAGGADIAVLRCPTRTLFGQWMPVATTDTETGPGIDVRWQHEVINMPTDVLTLPATDRQAHYTLVTGDHSQNFHYLGGSKNQLLPLRSLPWPTGQQRTRLSVMGTVVLTDIFGCHGTSGSGVFKTGGAAPELLGPTINGFAMTATAGGNLLCHRSTNVSPGMPLSSYTRLVHTQAATAIARNDLAESPRIDDIEWQQVGSISGTPQHIAVCQSGMQYIYRSDGSVLQSSTNGASWSSYTTLPTSLRGFSCGSRLIYYLKSDRHLWYIDTADVPPVPHEAGFPWAADDVGATEDTSLDFPILFARNTDNTLWRSGSGGADGTWVNIGSAPSGSKITSARNLLLSWSADGTLRSARAIASGTTSWHALPSTITTVRDIAMASLGQANVDVRIARVDTDGRVFNGTARLAFGY